MSERCDVTELLKDQCAHCRPPAPELLRRIGTPLMAMYRGECLDCGRGIEPDQWIVRVEGGGYAHEEC
jgi:hypothetical protein